jgi:glycosyltransferase involved in cell wall biosynthesis
MDTNIAIKDKPLVSVVINNFNYGRYLAESIETALNQVYDATEVIVVDDGSTDNSREIIASYGRRIVPVLKENGGQASALNAGFARSQGDIVIFLDADDRLLPTTTEGVVAAFRKHPGVGRIQYRVAVIDGAGRPTGWLMPPRHVGMANGDLRGDLRRMGNYAWPPTSGNAFSSWSLRRILPMPEQDLRLSADYFLLRANALLAPIVSLNDVVGAHYRLHGANAYSARHLDLVQLRRYVELVRQCHTDIGNLAGQLGYPDYPDDPGDLVDAFLLAQRLALLRLDNRPAPIREDARWWLARRGMVAAFQRPDAPVVRLLSAAWFPLMAYAPKPLARWLAGVFLSPEARRWLEAPVWFLAWRSRRRASAGLGW